MFYFTDYEIPIDKSIGITNLLGNITTKDHSHKGGWTKLLRCQLINEGYSNVKILGKGDRLSDFDIIIFDLGAEYSGGLNLFSGLDLKTYDRLIEIYDFNGQIFNWQHDLPSVLPLQKRVENKSTCEEFKKCDPDFLQSVENILEQSRPIDHVAEKKHFLIGDSHTPSVWTPDMEIYRQDGRTLFGSIRNLLFEEFRGECEEVTLYIGNIDIRHHLMRQEKKWDAVQALAMNYEQQIQQSFKDIKVNVVSLLPIEHESRKLPKTGFYKGTPFYGPWNERAAASEIFNRIMEAACKRNGWNLIKFPDHFKNDKKELDFSVMERPQSVHISPTEYRWDLDNNKKRW